MCTDASKGVPHTSWPKPSLSDITLTVKSAILGRLSNLDFRWWLYPLGPIVCKRPASSSGRHFSSRTAFQSKKCGYVWISVVLPMGTRFSVVRGRHLNEVKQSNCAGPFVCTTQFECHGQEKTIKLYGAILSQSKQISENTAFSRLCLAVHTRKLGKTFEKTQFSVKMNKPKTGMYKAFCC